MATSRIRWARQAPVLLRSIVQRRTFTATPAQRSEADNHRRGRPVTQMEAGFKEPHSPIRFGRFLAIGTAFCVAGLVWTYMPGSYHTEIGMEMRDKALEEFQDKEVEEGYRGEHETDAQRKAELRYRANHRGQAKGDVP